MRRKFPLWPGLLSVDFAAMYCSMNVTEFRKAVAGGDCPVEPIILIVPHYRGPEHAHLGIRRSIGLAGLFAWHHDGQDDDIIGYRIHQPKDSQ
jgi:hypothetical protein